MRARRAQGAAAGAEKAGKPSGGSARSSKGEDRAEEAAQMEVNDSLPLLSGFRTVVGETVCVVCRSNHDEADVLLCDDCGAEFHRRCLRPPLAAVPIEDWICAECVAAQVFAAPSELTRRFERAPGSSGKLSGGEGAVAPTALQRAALESLAAARAIRTLHPVVHIPLLPDAIAALDAADAHLREL
jgi:PHD-finger